MNINPNFPAPGNTPIIGQQQMPVIQAIAIITPEMLKKMEAWCEKAGMPMNEIGNTIFRLGLIMFSVSVNEPELADDEVCNLIPLTDNEKKAGRTDG